jgi:hypothetical protein
MDIKYYFKIAIITVLCIIPLVSYALITDYLDRPEKGNYKQVAEILSSKRDYAFVLFRSVIKDDIITFLPVEVLKGGANFSRNISDLTFSHPIEGLINAQGAIAQIDPTTLSSKGTGFIYDGVLTIQIENKYYNVTVADYISGAASLSKSN